jgi:hypothetical protein
MAEQRRQVGRVVFHQDKTWTVLTLACHVNNVVRLVEVWDWQNAFPGASAGKLALSRDHVVTAAQIHDMAKPSHFRLRYEGAKFSAAKWEYSFSGHRFGVEHDHPYVKLLGLLHHEYSVDGITRAIAQLRNEPEVTAYADNFALDLYTLEMADQIEATVARAAVGSESPEERVFMDFVFEPLISSDCRYRIDPFPFVKVPVSLQIEYAVLHPPSDQVTAVEQAKSQESRKPLLTALQVWLLDALQTASLETQEITLWPWTR